MRVSRDLDLPCEARPLGCEIDDAAPDQDLIGLGVVIAFCLSALSCYAVAFVAYVLGAVHPDVLGVFDTQVLRIHARPRVRLRMVAEKAILLLGDQLLVTGIGLLVAGFVRLAFGPVTLEDWNAILSLAWFSATTHLVSITIFRVEYRADVFQRRWRVIGLVCMFFLLQAALLPGYTTLAPNDNFTMALFGSYDMRRAYYLLGSRTSPELQKQVILDTAFTSVFLTIIFARKIYLLYPITWKKPTWLRVQERLELVLSKLAIRQTINQPNLQFRATLVASMLIVSFRDYFSSLHFAMQLLIATLIWGMVKIAIAEIRANHVINNLGFGQIIALSLLAIPLLAILEAALKTSRRSQEDHDRRVEAFAAQARDTSVESPISPDETKTRQNLMGCLLNQRAGDGLYQESSTSEAENPDRLEHRVLRPFYAEVSALWPYKAFCCLHGLLVLALITHLSYLWIGATGPHYGSNQGYPAVAGSVTSAWYAELAPNGVAVNSVFFWWFILLLCVFTIALADSGLGTRYSKIRKKDVEEVSGFGRQGAVQVRRPYLFDSQYLNSPLLFSSFPHKGGFR